MQAEPGAKLDYATPGRDLRPLRKQIGALEYLAWLARIALVILILLAAFYALMAI